MSPDEVLAGLETRVGMLGGGGPLTPVHHRTVRAAVEWSHQLLVPTSKGFRGLAVFVGGFDAGAAASVAPRLSLDVLAPGGQVAGRRDPDRAGKDAVPGCRRPSREHARVLLVEAGEWDAARERHLRHVSALADVARGRSGCPQAPSGPSTRSTTLQRQVQRHGGGGVGKVRALHR